MTQRSAESGLPPGPPHRFDPAAFLFNAAGRSGRTAYLVGVILAGLLMKSTLLVASGAAQIAWGVLVGFPGFAIWGVLSARRLHDLGLAGWWFALLAALAVFAPHSLAPPQTAQQWMAGSVLGALTAALLLWPGQRRFNRFGPRPG